MPPDWTAHRLQARPARPTRPRPTRPRPMRPRLRMTLRWMPPRRIRRWSNARTPRSTRRCRRMPSAGPVTTPTTTASSIASTVVLTTRTRLPPANAAATFRMSTATETASPIASICARRIRTTRPTSSAVASESRGSRPRAPPVRIGLPADRLHLQWLRRLWRSQQLQPVRGRPFHRVGRRAPDWFCGTSLPPVSGPGCVEEDGGGGPGATWMAAQSACAAKGLTLARIESIDDSDFITGLMTARLWIGANDLQTAGQWYCRRPRPTATPCSGKAAWMDRGRTTSSSTGPPERRAMLRARR